MPKVKTHKGAAKRIRKTPTGKLLIRSAAQSHFNSRDTGKVTKNKRRDQSIVTVANKFKTLIPYK